jgi:thioredoxin
MPSQEELERIQHEMGEMTPIDPEAVLLRERIMQNLKEKTEELDRIKQEINTPEINDFIKGVQLEATHQRERWEAEHDAGKTSSDWFWLLGYLGGKALYSFLAGDIDKAKHHIITTAAACANWHSAVCGGVGTKMRPGIEEPKEFAEQKSIIDLTSDNFDKEVTNYSGIILIDFWASWCGPCRVLSPIIDELFEEYKKKVKFCKVNTDDAPKLSNKYNITSIPTLMLLRDGNFVDRLTGAHPKYKIKEKLIDFHLK